MQASPNLSPQAAFECRFRSTLQNVSATVQELTDYCRGSTGKSEFAEIAVEQVELCVAEALTNVVKHAYAFQDDKSVNVSCAMIDGQIVVEIEDEGKELPPHLLKTTGPRDLGADIVELPENGFGWYLIMDQMDAVEYDRRNGVNHLRMVKRVRAQ